MKLYLLISTLCILFSCQSKDREKSSVKEKELIGFSRDTLLTFRSFSFTAPKGWRCANDDTLPVYGDATSRRRLHNENGKLIHYEHGLSTFGERFSPYPIPAYRRAGYLDRKFDTSGWIFSDDPRLSNFMRLSEHDISTQKISGFNALIYKPKALGNGYSGLYIDSTDVLAGHLVEFAVYGENLDSLEIVQLMNAITTLKIRPFK